MSLKGKLDRFKAHLTKVAPGEPPSEVQPEAAPAIEIPFLQVWEEWQAKPYFHDGGYAICREISYPISQQHGIYAFEQLHEVVEEWNRMACSHPLSAAGLLANDLLFFDTETTGLHGGVGNAIFLIGFARVLKDRVAVKQFFLPGPEAEVAFYQGFLTEVKEWEHLITYNGKAFDWPQVKTRHTLLRNLLPQLPAFGHYDLLHASRRLWKHELESCRLAQVEREILGVHRQDDTPGHLAPLLYFDYLRDKNPDPIKGVLKHNETDVLSLITLYIHISRLLQQRHPVHRSARELHEIGRWFEQTGDLQRAMVFFQQAIEEDDRNDLSIKLSLAALHKKVKNWEQAIAIWEEIIRTDSAVHPDVFTELAKVYEHHRKDYEKALFYADKAYESWKSRSKLLRNRAGAERQQLLKRIERLEAKCYIHSSICWKDNK